MNTVVFPPAGPDSPIYVYILTPQSDLQKIPFGGHYRVVIGGNGAPLAVRPFTNTCLEMSREATGADKPSALVVGHLLDPVPTEIHVFEALSAGLPIYVGTVNNGRVWLVDGPHISLVKDKK